MTEITPPLLGESLPDWRPPSAPQSVVMKGQFSYLEPLRADAHAALMYPVFSGADHVWDYMYAGPFSSASQFHRWVRSTESEQNTQFLAIKNLETGRWEGIASYLRIAPHNGSIEVGNISLSPALQRTRAATEAMFLMMQWAFETGYRRYEWKCNSLNIPSRRAAQRLGFSYEGIFRQAMIVKGRNRDTAWFAAIDREWPALKEAFSVWLRPENFDADGHQKERLSDLTRLVRSASDPAL